MAEGPALSPVEGSSVNSRTLYLTSAVPTIYT